MYEDEERHDFGFDLPDTRHQFITTDGKVSVIIIRHWYMNDDEYEPDFKVSFDIHFDGFDGQNKITNLPIGTTEEQAINIAHVLWNADEEATDSLDELKAMEEAERKMGA
jgi:hypothetical protein